MAEEHYVSQEDLRMVLRAELAEFKLAILGEFKQLATKADHEALAGRVTVIEAHGTPQAQSLVREQGEMDARLSVLEGWRNRSYGVYALLAFEIPVIATISWHIWG